MANKEYYERWLKIKDQLNNSLIEDARLQELAKGFVGIKPQATAVEIVSRVYCKYCDLYNKLCEIYDQMEQPQRQVCIKKIIDAITCRILELKYTLEEVEVFEFTYPDNALQQMLMTPNDIEILCPFFYPFETRQEELQYIVDQILAGNRLGDPKPTASELELREEQRLAEEEIIRAEKEAEIRRKMAMGEEIFESVESLQMSAEEKEQIRLEEEYKTHISNIQRMEKARRVKLCTAQKINKDNNLYLELAGLKAPQHKDSLRNRAASFIQKVYRRFMEVKRAHERDYRVKAKLGMIMTAHVPPSAKIRLEKVKEARRTFRKKYYEQWIKAHIKEKSRVLRLREGDIIEDISVEIRSWLQNWYEKVRVFDEFPFPDEGGSIVIANGDTFSIEEYVEWRIEEEKRLKKEASSPKSKEDIKNERMAAKEEKKRLALEAKDKEKKRIEDYKKQRLNPDNDPGVYITIGENVEKLQKEWFNYECEWKSIDAPDAPLEVIRGFIGNFITENAYHEVHLQLRRIVDDMMRIEYTLLKTALKNDYASVTAPIPIVLKRQKPKKVKPPKPEKIPPEVLFQNLVDAGLVRKYPHTTLDDYWGDRNYAAADMRAELWTPKFPSACTGDVREQIRVRCMLTLGSSCPNAVRSQLLVGPKGAGKRTLAYAIATETNSILIDLSPMNVYDKLPGPKGLKTIFNLVNKVSRIMQPTVILVNDADKLFYKKVPKEEKIFDPTRLSKDFYKEIIKGLKGNDKVLVLGTASEPWFAKTATMSKAFPSLILIPITDYGSISFILTKMLMTYHGVDREFDVHSVAQALRGYDIKSIRKGIMLLLDGKRIAELGYRPLQPMEVVRSVTDLEDSSYTDSFDNEMFKEWYLSYSAWGHKYLEYMIMIESQYQFKLKADKKKKT